MGFFVAGPEFHAAEGANCGRGALESLGFDFFEFHLRPRLARAEIVGPARRFVFHALYLDTWGLVWIHRFGPAYWTDPGAAQRQVFGAAYGDTECVSYLEPRVRSRLKAALISARWVNACGKLPSASPWALVCSAYRPRWLA